MLCIDTRRAHCLLSLAPTSARHCTISCFVRRAHPHPHPHPYRSCSSSRARRPLCSASPRFDPATVSVPLLTLFSLASPAAQWDHAISSLLVRSSLGAAFGVVFSVLLFKRRAWPAWVGLGFGAGRAWEEADGEFHFPNAFVCFVGCEVRGLGEGGEVEGEGRRCSAGARLCGSWKWKRASTITC